MLHEAPHKYSQDEPILKFVDVTSTISGNIVLENIDLLINRGDFIALLGPSGSGKTTLLRTIMGLTNVSNGEVVMNGKSADVQRPNVGYMPQMSSINWNFPISVEQVVLMGTISKNKLYPWFSKTAKDAAFEIMEKMGIVDVRSRHVNELSGGQKQRVLLSRSLINNPHLLLLDEPTTGIDIKTRDEVMHILHELNHRDVTIIMATHEINAVAAHLPRVVCLNRNIISDGAPKDIFTVDILTETYGAPIHVTRYKGLPIVAESPHVFNNNIK
jgi:zinc/manganese transport system ATP-binding protein/zinc transport system ATP-binding protein